LIKAWTGFPLGITFIDPSPPADVRLSVLLFIILNYRDSLLGNFMKKRLIMLSPQEDFLVDLTFHGISSSLIADFAEKIVKPYYDGNLNAAFQDLVQKALAEHEFVLSHITHIRTKTGAKAIDQDS
jgi:hypothetical protein